MSDLIIRMEDIRAAGMCSRGARSFFKAHSLDWDTFIKNGLPSETIEATKDAMALKVVEVARGRKQ